MKLTIIKNISKILLCGAILLGPTSCKDFLDEEAPSNLTPDNFYTIPDHAEAALAAVYADMRTVYDGAGIFSSSWQLLEAPTGTSTTETAQNSDLNNLYGLNYDGNTQHVINWWNGLYRVIAQSNQLLSKVPNITPMDEGQKNRVLGQARFLRAWAYFNAVRLWGDIPLITEPQTIESEDFFPTRTPQQEIYNLIVEDLKAAEASGLPWMDASGHASMAAVKSELARVYLTMAGQPLNKGAEYYKLAADKAFEVITYANANPSVINLFQTYYEVHSEATENKVEHIFMLQYNNVVAGNPMENMYPNFKPVTYNGPGGTGSTIPTPAFYASYEPGDLRAKNQEGYFYTSYYTNGNGDEFQLGAPYIFKHFNLTSSGTVITKIEPNGTITKTSVNGTRNNNLNVPQIRYAEVLLIYAEAQNEVGGPTVDTYEAINKVRRRAKIPELNGLSQQQFREAVWQERWHELCYEQITWFDMVRLRKVYNETTKGFDDFVGHVNKSSNQPLTAKNLLFPVPVPEIRNNSNLTQNPDYK
ncbi:RagB/SusD family nutrient uptake outer membrane protein [Adhaeribacter arboris]|uniref:RagB/SusD family nutrient uptake outer membrane protein n=1 Tax=Adhaeribacter arboris TaxID=2072846 RepID=A0A2T2YHJ3_9BACT|nr:RagB/SusD family nutrient uptake outer membrane protein [Adhaeribacter arboris]PSR54962.1 RagB/SusD family nutrient uptake outer membrane protein [Adhaeribacter arboris]